jgi:hypothetical protein
MAKKTKKVTKKNGPNYCKCCYAPVNWLDTPRCHCCHRPIDNRGGDTRYTARGKIVLVCSSCLE